MAAATRRLEDKMALGLLVLGLAGRAIAPSVVATPTPRGRQLQAAASVGDDGGALGTALSPRETVGGEDGM